MLTRPSPLVSYVLVSWNRCRDLEVALHSIRRQVSSPPFEVIVVDNGSTDGTAEMLLSGRCGPVILYRAAENLGASVARNIGLQLVSGELIAFMDSDAELQESDTLAFLTARLNEDPELAAVAPAIYADSERREPWFLGGYLIRSCFWDMPRTRRDWKNPDFLSTCFSLWRRTALIDAGGFDPAYPYGIEDCDLSLRVRDAGWRLAVDPSRSVWHHISRDGRIRPWETWAHHCYAEQSRNRVLLSRLGLRKWLGEAVWLWSAPGRRLRNWVYTGSGLNTRHFLWLFGWIPLLTAFRHWPSIRSHFGHRRDWITTAPVEPERIIRSSQEF